MKKYVHVLEDKIVTRYESDKTKSFGGPWAQGVSIEVPEEMNLDLVVLDNKGQPKERAKKQEELDEELKDQEKKDFKELLRGLSKSDMDTVAEVKEVLHKLIKALL
jgi:dipeptidase